MRNPWSKLLPLGAGRSLQTARGCFSIAGWGCSRHLRATRCLATRSPFGGQVILFVSSCTQTHRGLAFEGKTALLQNTDSSDREVRWGQPFLEAARQTQRQV